MATDPPVPALPVRSMSGFQRPGRSRLPQARGAQRVGRWGGRYCSTCCYLREGGVFGARGRERWRDCVIYSTVYIDPVCASYRRTFLRMKGERGNIFDTKRRGSPCKTYKLGIPNLHYFPNISVRHHRGQFPNIRYAIPAQPVNARRFAGPTRCSYLGRDNTRSTTH